MWEYLNTAEVTSKAISLYVIIMITINQGTWGEVTKWATGVETQEVN